MATPPILDVFVVWHPTDSTGSTRFEEIQAHFHSVAFSGLAGGAVEVYARSIGWSQPFGAPRPLGIDGGLGDGLPAAQFNVVVPIVDVELARAVGDVGGSWAGYFAELARFASMPNVLVLPLVVDGMAIKGTPLERFVGQYQALAHGVAGNPKVLGRELSQAIAQWVEVGESRSGRLTLFISHTKWETEAEEGSRGPRELVQAVRERILETRLADFFDAQDIQAGDDWAEVLEREAGNAALLMLRTDLYASREWTQAEVRAAKLHDMPVVSMYALRDGEERGSFLMDHVPTVTCDISDPLPGIDAALRRLADEALKNVLWRAQEVFFRKDGFDWLPANSPEPTTMVSWLLDHKTRQPQDRHIWVLHPDPPLQLPEQRTLEQLCRLAGYVGTVDILTPRTFAQHGGVLGRD